jgi:hypothetical protein
MSPPLTGFLLSNCRLPRDFKLLRIVVHPDQSRRGLKWIVYPWPGNFRIRFGGASMCSKRCLGIVQARQCFRVAPSFRTTGGITSGKPPFGFGADEFRTPLVYVDPRQIVYVPDDNGRRTVLFPVVLSPTDPQKRKTVWVKAGLGAPINEDAGAVEQLLKVVLAEVQQEKDAPSQAENSQGEVKVSANTVAVTGLDRQSVARHALTSS